MKKEQFIDILNIVYVIWVVAFLFIVYTQVPFTLFGENITTSLKNIYVSWYHIIILAIIGSIMPKSERKQLFYISIFCSLIMSILALASAILAFSKGEYIATIISTLVFIVGLIKTIVDYKRGE